jgi:hypothetical protein
MISRVTASDHHIPEWTSRTAEPEGKEPNSKCGRVVTSPAFLCRKLMCDSACSHFNNIVLIIVISRPAAAKEKHCVLVTDFRISLLGDVHVIFYMVMP